MRTIVVITIEGRRVPARQRQRALSLWNRSLLDASRVALAPEFPAVVVPVLTQHYPMLQRNLLYTAVTRARMLAVVVGSWKAIAIAVRSERAGQRYTRLRERLQSEEVLDLPVE